MHSETPPTQKLGNCVCLDPRPTHTLVLTSTLTLTNPFTFTHRVIYHDALSTWWSAGGQQHMRELGFEHKQIRSLGPTNVGTRYEGGLVGGSPSFMPLDNNLFADYSRSILANVCATRHLPADHPDKFCIGTPASAWKAMVRTWEHSPTSERIVEDIQRWQTSIRDVVEAEGISINWHLLRRGRRLEEHRKYKRKQRSAAVAKAGQIEKMPIHVSARNVYNAFLNIDLTQIND